MTVIHVNYGYAKRRCPERPKCMFCGKRRVWMAFTYFGAPVCRECWDGTWRKQEDGECDPPFDAITREHSGEWLTSTPNRDRDPASEPRFSHLLTDTEDIADP